MFLQTTLLLILSPQLPLPPLLFALPLTQLPLFVVLAALPFAPALFIALPVRTLGWLTIDAPLIF